MKKLLLISPIATKSLLGGDFYFRLPYKPWYYILPSGIFAAFHFSHALLVYLRSQ